MHDNIPYTLLKDQLAWERTRLANERTFLSYIRTSLYFLVGGVALITVKSLDNTMIPGIAAVVFSGMLITTGTYRYIRMRSKLKRSVPQEIAS